MYTLRSCIGPKRWLGCLLPCAARCCSVCWRAPWWSRRPSRSLGWRLTASFALVIPIAALVIGDAVLGAEVRAGTFQFTWLTPTPLSHIVLGRWLGGCIVTLVTIVPACALAAVIADDAASAGPVAIAAFGGASQASRSSWPSAASTRRAAVWSLAFVFLFERLLGSALTGIAQWSPTWESRAAFVDFIEDAPKSLIREGIPVGTGAMVRLGVITLIGLGVARWRLAHMRMSGASD